MIDRRVLIGLSVTLLALWSAGPVLADAQSGRATWIQMYGKSAALEPESLLAACDSDEDADFDAMEGMSWRGARRAALQEQREDLEDIAGRVHDFFTTTVPGESNQHVLAQIDTPRGTATVDLGPVDQVPRIEPGEFIRLRGFWGQANNRTAFVTSSLNSGERTVRIFVGPQRQNMRQIHGEVLGTYTITSDQSGQQLRFARIRMDNGRTRAVNLGSPSDTANLGLKQGDEITAVGQPVGLRRFRAHEVSANGRTVPIDWSAVVQGRFGQRLQQAGYTGGR